MKLEDAPSSDASPSDESTPPAAAPPDPRPPSAAASRQCAPELERQTDTRTAAESIEQRPASHPAPPHASRHDPPLSQRHDPDRYELLGEHGRGGLGKVTRAHDHNLGRDVAIKELIAHSPLAELRFQREALITARLEHPGIVPVHEAGRWPDGTPFYAMKLVAGRPLRALIAERHTVEERLALLHHVIAVADAIAYAHGRGIIHRDLKPANVIVGDFGETVVIDWGLAKDLGTADDLPDGAPSPDSPDLTSAGSVLGTPAYMAPEQARGEPVDPRADVFAIGAMLWELCALATVPPADRRARDRLLRRNRIDADLIAIIDKALAADRDRRYPDAGALAADLKAFKAGARIASRDYSLLATLVHWARRHRALAIGVVAMAIALVTGVALYVHGVATERRLAERFNNDLLLSNAEAGMQRDPTLAAETLRQYTGVDLERKNMLAVEARARGAAIVSRHIDTESYMLVYGVEGPAIVSPGKGKTIIKTSLTGTITTLGHYSTDRPVYDYSAQASLLIYSCRATTLCALNLVTDQERWQLELDGASQGIIDIGVSPNAQWLAALTGDQHVLIWSIARMGQPALVTRLELTSARWLKIIDDRTLMIADGQNLIATSIDISDRSSPATRTMVQSDETVWGRQITNSSTNGLLVLGTNLGDLQLIDSHTGALVRSSRVCASGVLAIQWLKQRSKVVYSCHDGEVGLWEPERDLHVSLLRHRATLFTLTESQDGCCLYMGGYSGELLAYNFDTERLSKYKGHPGRIFVIQAASPQFPYILSVDHFGNIRVWPSAPSDVHLLAQRSTGISRATWIGHDGGLLAIDKGPTALWYRQGHTGEIAGHKNHNIHFFSSPPPDTRLAAFGALSSFELWTFGSTPSFRLIEVPGERVLHVAFLPGRDYAVVASSTSSQQRLWRVALSNGPKKLLATLDQGIIRSSVCSGDRILFQLQHSIGILDGDVFQIVERSPAVHTTVDCSPNGAWFAHGSSTGDVGVQGIINQWHFQLYQADTAIKDLTFSPDGRELAIVSENQLVVRPMPTATTDDRDPAARLNRPLRIEAARRVTYSPDGIWLAVTCDNGDVWFYRRADGHWSYRSAGDEELVSAQFSPDSLQFMTAGIDGRLLLYDIGAIGQATQDVQ